MEGIGGLVGYKPTGLICLFDYKAKRGPGRQNFIKYLYSPRREFGNGTRLRRFKVNASDDGGQDQVSPKNKISASAVLEIPKVIWKKTFNPLSNFGFGKKSAWEGGVGLFMISGVILLAFSLVWLKGLQVRSRYKKYQAVVEFSQASGITIGTPVRIRGFTVGSVVKVKPSLEKIDAVIQVKDAKIVIPRNSLVEVNQSGLLMETLIDITPRPPIPSPSVGPLDPDCGKEGLIVCDRDRIKGEQGVSLDELVGIFTRLGRQMDEISVTKSYELAERIALTIEEAKPLLEKAEAMAGDMQPLLREVREGGLLKEIERFTKVLADSSEDLRKLNSSFLTLENTKTLQQMVSTLIRTLKNIERISADVSGVTGDLAFKHDLKKLIECLSRILVD